MANKYTDITGLLYVITKVKALLAKKADAETGKGLSENDFTSTLKTKLEGIAANATNNTIDSALSGTSTNAIQNKVVNDALGLKAPLSSPALSGTPTTPTAAAGNNTAQIASTAFVTTAVANAVAGVYKIKGSILFSALPTTGMSVGDVYNVTDSFTTTASFMEGAGKTYPAGTNIVYNSSSKWDCLAGIYDFSGYMLSSDMVAVTTAEIDAMFT